MDAAGISLDNFIALRDASWRDAPPPPWYKDDGPPPPLSARVMALLSDPRPPAPPPLSARVERMARTRGSLGVPLPEPGAAWRPPGR